MWRAYLILLLSLPLLLATSCGSPDFSYFESITSGPNPGATLILVWLSDSPADEAEQVEVTIERVELLGPDGTLLLSGERQTIDLLTLQNGNRLKIADTEIPEGHYEQLRLTLATTGGFAPQVRENGTLHPLQFSALNAHIVDIPYPFHAPAGLRTELQLDFNVRLSIDKIDTDWTLSPHVDAVNPNAVGSVAGRVVDELGLPVAGATVVARQGGFELRSTRSALDGSYRLTLLQPGSYELQVLGPLGPVVEEPNVLVGLGLTTDLNFRY